MTEFSYQVRVIPVAASLLFALLTCCGVSRAGNLFVDQANPKADDKNAGTMEAPFKTNPRVFNIVVAMFR